MVIRVLLSLITLSIIAYLGINYAKKKSIYSYSYTLSPISKISIEEDLRKEINYYQNKITKKRAYALDYSKLAQLYANRAKAFNSSEDFVLAQRFAFKSISLTREKNPKAFYILSDIAFFNQNYKQAINYAKIILNQKKSSSAEAYFILANSYYLKGEMALANYFADELITAFPSEKAYVLRAEIFAVQGREDEAVSDFEEAIKLGEDNQVQAAITRAMYGKYFLERSSVRGNLDKAFELLSESLRVHPTYSIALGLMGDYFVKDKDYRLAAEYYKKAFAESKQINFLFKEAIVHEKIGQFDFANNLFAQVEILLRNELKQNKNANAADLIRFLLERGDRKKYQEAMMLARLQMKKREDIDSIILYSWSLEANNQLTEANRIIRGLINRSIRSDEVLNRAKTIEEKLKNKNITQFFEKNLNFQTSI